VINLLFKGFTEELQNGGRIEIRGFGSFVVRNYNAYTGRNPKTGKNIKVSPKRLPFFKVGKELKERVDGKGGDKDPDRG
jgi:integration host factor subunit beta